MNAETKYELTDEAKAQLVVGVIRKIRNAGDIGSPDSRMVFAIFEQAVKDATWKPLPKDMARVAFSEVSKRRIREGEDCRKEAREWFGHSQCARYLELLGIDPQYAVDKVRKLLRLVDA